MTAVLCPNGLAARRLVCSQRKRCISRKQKRAVRICRHATPRSYLTRRLGQPVKQRTHSCKVQSVLGVISYASHSRDFFDAAINSLVGGSALVCFALAFVPLLTYEGDERVEDTESDALETVKWSVASVVSCFPYLNWTSWLLIAFDSDPPLPYYFLSALYFIPFLKSGFDFDGLTIFMLVLGILHIQVERMAQTEPAILGSVVEDRSQFSSPLKSVSQAIGRQLPMIVSKSRLFAGREKGSTISELVDRELTKKERDLEEAEELARLEQKFWDERFEEDRNI